MKIVRGKTYLTSDGRVVKILQVSKNRVYGLLNGEIHSWTSEGSYKRNKQDSKDLVMETV